MKAFAIMILSAGLAQAEPRPAPDYFIQVTFATTTAQALAQSCPSLSFALLKASRASGSVMAQLSDDGFVLDTLTEDMADPAPQFAALREAFLTRHALADGAPTDAVCKAGHAEIAEATEIGAYLVAVAP